MYESYCEFAQVWVYTVYITESTVFHPHFLLARFTRFSEEGLKLESELRDRIADNNKKQKREEAARRYKTNVITTRFEPKKSNRF